MMFKTQFDAHERVIQAPGSRVKTLYSARYGDDGSIVLEEKGKENLYDYIQSHAESVDIHVLLKRYAQGEVDILSQVQGTYGDFTGMPRTYADLLNRVNDGKQWFDSLPVEVRARFDHDFGKFMVAMDSPDFLSRLGVDCPDGPEKLEPESKDVGGTAE